MVNLWHQFLKKNRGMGYSMTDLSEKYQKDHRNQSAGRFLCCKTESEEQAVRNYIKEHKQAIIKKLQKVGIYDINVKASLTREKQYGRFIIAFLDIDGNEVYHFTIVCDSRHWDESYNKREPHFTKKREHYFYVYNDFKLESRDSNVEIPKEVVNTMETMLNTISSDVCPMSHSVIIPSKKLLIERPSISDMTLKKLLNINQPSIADIPPKKLSIERPPPKKLSIVRPTNKFSRYTL